MPSLHSAQTQHRVRLVQPLDRGQHPLLLRQTRGVEAPGRDLVDLARHVDVRGQELVQRRVDQPDDHRQAVHGAEETEEVLALERQQLRETFARPPPVSSLCRIMRCTCGRRSGWKNMCSVRQRPIPWAPYSRARWASTG